MDIDKYQSIITKYNVDTKGNPIAIVRIDNQKVHPTKLMIQTAILDEAYRVSILNENMREVVNIEDITAADNFYVDYSNGRIFFHASMAGKTIQYKCAELGLDMINANRVVSELDEYGNIKEVLSDLISDVKNAVVTSGIVKENKEFNISADSLQYNSTTGLYEYKLKHGLKTTKIQISVYSGASPLLDLCRKLDADNIIVANDEKVNISVVINYGSVS